MASAAELRSALAEAAAIADETARRLDGPRANRLLERRMRALARR